MLDVHQFHLESELLDQVSAGFELLAFLRVQANQFALVVACHRTHDLSPRWLLEIGNRLIRRLAQHFADLLPTLGARYHAGPARIQGAAGSRENPQSTGGTTADN